MSARDERMIQFRLDVPRINEPVRPGEVCLMRVSAILCLFPEHRQIKTIENGWTVAVCKEDWDKVEMAFRYAYLDNEVHAI